MGRIEVDRGEPGAAIIALVGEHEDFSVPQLERALDDAVRDRLSVVVDLAQAEFISSTIVAILLRAREEAHVTGCRFSVVIDDTTGQAVRRLFEITGLGAILPLAASRTEALAS